MREFGSRRSTPGSCNLLQREKEKTAVEVGGEKYLASFRISSPFRPMEDSVLFREDDFYKRRQAMMQESLIICRLYWSLQFLSPPWSQDITAHKTPDRRNQEDKRFPSRRQNHDQFVYQRNPIYE